MLNLKKGINSLFRKVTTSLPPDVESALKAAAGNEGIEPARNELLTVLDDVQRSRADKTPICKDTGVPFFYVSAPKGLSHSDLRKTIVEATAEATEKVPLPLCSVDPVTGKTSDNNTGEGFPVIHISETDSTNLSIELMLLGTSSESLGKMFILPDKSITTESGIAGIEACVIETVKKAGGKGCPPYIIGVGIGPTRDRAAWLGKQQLRRKLDDANPIASVHELEMRILEQVNSLGIGPNKMGGSTTALGVKIGAHHHHPKAAYVDVTLLCWNTRRGKLIW